MATAIQKILRDKFGGDVTTIHRQIAGGADKNEFISNNPERVALTIINNTTNRGAIAFRASASGNEKIYIEANGGTLILNVNEDGDLPALPVYNQYVSASVTFYVIETIRINIEGDVP